MSASPTLDAIAWVVAVVGWASTHLFAEARERRKEVRSQLDKLQDYLLSLEKSGRDFHSAPAFDVAKSMDLTTAVHNLERKFERIGILKIDNLIAYNIAFKRAITMKNFEQARFEQQTETSEILAEISGSAHDLEDALEMQYKARYPNSFPYFRLR